MLIAYHAFHVLLQKCVALLNLGRLRHRQLLVTSTTVAAAVAAVVAAITSSAAIIVAGILRQMFY